MSESTQPRSDRSSGGFESTDHALQAGMLIGVLKAARINCWPQTDDYGFYINEILVILDDVDRIGARITVLPPPL